jgi:hypothetical protein
MRRLGCVFAAALLLAGVALGAPPAHARGALRHPTEPALRLPKSNAEYTLNWSGYAVPARAGQTITQVRGAWHVPGLKWSPPGFSSSWIGIGGYGTNDLIQVGTASSRVDGHYAWYEMLPDSSIPLSGCTGDPACRVAPSDRMTASVTNTGGDSWTLMMANLGKGGTPKWHWGMIVSYKSTLSSAEWVFEAPTVLVQTIPANAPHAKFLGGDYVVNGVATPLRPGGAVRVIMAPCVLSVNGFGCNYHYATPSLMAGDGHFQVCAYKPKCPNF